jgi:hypothetical protein
MFALFKSVSDYDEWYSFFHSTDAFVLITVQQDATGCSLFYFTAKNTVHVSGVGNTHHQEYIKL